jgi:hypothetical protein
VIKAYEQIAPFALIKAAYAGVFCGVRSDDLVRLFSKQGGKPMKASSLKSFSKKLACPSSNLLLSFHRQILDPEVHVLVRHHLNSCDFCYCEIPLLGFYTRPNKGECRAPELPINLRVLAESILGKDRTAGVVSERSASASAGRKELPVT